MNIENKTKKNIAQLIIIAAIAFSIAAHFSPIISFDFSDWWQGEIVESDIKEEAPIDWQAEYYYFLRYFNVQSFELDEITGGQSGFTSLNLFHLIEIRLRDDVNINNDINYYGNSNPYTNNPSLMVVAFSFIPAGFALILLCFYFGFVSLKNISNKYSKAPLYAGISFIISLIILVIAVYVWFAVLDANRGLSNYFVFGYGLYYSIISAILYFIGFFMQKTIDYTTEEDLQKTYCQEDAL